MNTTHPLSHSESSRWKKIPRLLWDPGIDPNELVEKLEQIDLVACAEGVYCAEIAPLDVGSSNEGDVDRI
jgi:hypothetical protein